MKKGLVNISALIMALIVLFSTLSFTIEKHICAGEVADVALFGDLERCDMPDSDHKNLLSFKKTSCCQDEFNFVQSSNTELKPSHKSKLQTQVFAALFTYTYLNIFENSEKDSNLFLRYNPPNIFKNIPILYETFLI